METNKEQKFTVAEVPKRREVRVVRVIESHRPSVAVAGVPELRYGFVQLRPKRAEAARLQGRGVGDVPGVSCMKPLANPRPSGSARITVSYLGSLNRTTASVQKAV